MTLPPSPDLSPDAAHPGTSAPSRFVVVARADPVICGHSIEARSLAETALARGFADVHILSWPLERLSSGGLPLKPLDRVLPYSPGITVERPEPVGDYRVPDGRYLAGLTGRLIELFSDGVPTVAMSLYLSPHADAVAEARRVARAMGGGEKVVTIAEAVGSDVTNVVRDCLRSGRVGAAARVLATYLDADHCVAVSRFTRDLIVEAAEEVDARLGTRFAPVCSTRVAISYPAVDAAAYLDLPPGHVDAVLGRRGLERDGYALFLSRLVSAKGLDDLLAGYAASRARHRVRLVLAGRGPQEEEVRDLVARSGLGDRVDLLLDVDDAEKPALMAGCAAFVLPSRPQAEFTETFGIALVEKMLAGGGPVITCATGGIPEAVGGTAVIVPTHSPDAIRAALDDVVCDWTPQRRAAHEAAARDHARQFDRFAVFDLLLGPLDLRRVA